MNKIKELIKRIERIKDIVHIMLGIIIILFVMVIVLAVRTGVNKNKATTLNREIAEMKEQEEQRLKNSDEYDEFERIVLRFGQEMYIRTCNYYSSGYFKTSETKQIKGKEYWKIERIDEIKNIFSEKKFKDFIKSENIVNDKDEYYIIASNKNVNDLYIPDRSGRMAIDTITNYKIEFLVEEVYYNDENGILDINNLETKVNKFTIIKENELWRVDEFTDPNK